MGTVQPVYKNRCKTMLMMMDFIFVTGLCCRKSASNARMPNASVSSSRSASVVTRPSVKTPERVGFVARCEKLQIRLLKLLSLLGMSFRRSCARLLEWPLDSCRCVSLAGSFQTKLVVVVQSYPPADS